MGNLKSQFLQECLSVEQNGRKLGPVGLFVGYRWDFGPETCQHHFGVILGTFLKISCHRTKQMQILASGMYMYDVYKKYTYF